MGERRSSVTPAEYLRMRQPHCGAAARRWSPPETCRRRRSCRCSVLPWHAERHCRRGRGCGALPPPPSPPDPPCRPAAVGSFTGAHNLISNTSSSTSCTVARELGTGLMTAAAAGFCITPKPFSASAWAAVVPPPRICSPLDDDDLDGLRPQSRPAMHAETARKEMTASTTSTGPKDPRPSSSAGGRLPARSTAPE